MSMRFLSRLWKTQPQRLLSRMYVCREFSTSILRLPLPSQNLSQQAWSRYFSYGTRDDIESSTIDVDDAEVLLVSDFEPDDEDHHRFQLAIADNDAVLHELQQCQSLEEV